MRVRQKIYLYPIISLLVALFAFIGYITFKHYNSFVIINAALDNVLRDPVKTDRRQLVMSIITNYPKQPGIPDAMRQFFYQQPTLCVVNQDGSDLVVDDIGVSCFSEEDAFNKRAKSHEMERSEFLIPFYLNPSPFNGKQIFLKSIKMQRGVWIKMKLVGYIVPPPVETKPIFISFTPYCKTHLLECERLFDAQ